MANVKFLAGGINNLDKQPITPGTIYFAISENAKTETGQRYGYIVYDFLENGQEKRITMSTVAEIAGKIEKPLIIGDQIYDGTQEVVVPVYDGKSDV